MNSISRKLTNRDPNIKTLDVGIATGGNKSNYTKMATAGGTVTTLYAENSNELFTKLSEAIKQISGSTLTFDQAVKAGDHIAVRYLPVSG